MERSMVGAPPIPTPTGLGGIRVERGETERRPEAKDFRVEG